MKTKRAALLCVVLLAGAYAVAQSPAGEEEEGVRTRALWNTAFLNRRPPKPEPKSSAGGTAVASVPKPKPAPPAGEPKASAPARTLAEVGKLGSAFVGVTLWRMTRDLGSVPAVRFRGLVHEEDPEGTAEWTPQRVSLKSQFEQRDMVRLSVESAREGYLYIIDRDVYADGTMSAPTLIFPTLRLREGNNKVRPGVPYEIPEPTDKPPAFRMKKTRADQVAIRITMIVSPQPIREIRIGRSAQKLDPAKAAEWEAKWGQEVVQLEDPKLIGQAYSQAEARAAQEVDSLGSDDPLPTSLFRSAASEDQPMLVNLTLNMK